jgi:hypothetical protein
MTICTVPCQRACRDTWNRVLVHPIQSLDDKVMASGRSLDKLGRIWTQGGAGRPGLVSNGHQTWSRASTLTQEPMGSLVHHIWSHGGSDKIRTMWPKPRQVHKPKKQSSKRDQTSYTCIREASGHGKGARGPHAMRGRPHLGATGALLLRSTSPIREMASTMLHKCRSYVSFNRWPRWSWRGSTSPPSYTWSLQPTSEPVLDQIFARVAFTTAFGSKPRPHDWKSVKSRAEWHPT